MLRFLVPFRLPFRFSLRLSLPLLRLLSHLSLFLESQRLLLLLLRPPSSSHSLIEAESQVLDRNTTTTPLHHFLSLSPSHHLHLLHLPATRPCPARRPLILVHGHSMCGAFWAPVFDGLHARGHSLFVPDLPGWGRSSRGGGVGGVECAVNAVRRIVEEFELRDVVVVGHSMGGYVAMLYAQRFDTAGVVLLAPAGVERSIPVRRALYFGLPPQRVVRRAGLMGWAMFWWWCPRGDRWRQGGMGRLAWEGGGVGEGAEVEVGKMVGVGWKGGWFRKPLLEEIGRKEVRGMLLVGETDESVGVESVRNLWRKTKELGWDVGWQVVDGADHCLMLDKPEVVVDVVAHVAQSPAPAPARKKCELERQLRGPREKQSGIGEE